MKKIILLPLSCLLLACHGESQQERDERLGAEQLTSARTLLVDGQYDAARDSILALRRTHPLAMKARRQAILLLDSIELAAARDSLTMIDELSAEREQTRQGINPMSEQERLSVKVRFFERKLQEDLK